MKIVDLSPENENLYCQCLEDWSDDIKEAGDHKTRWVSWMKDKGLTVKMAANDEGVIGGMIQYIPIELAAVEGRDLAYVLCIWVHGHKQGRGNFQKRGFGRALIQAAEADARAKGYKGMVTWGMSIPVFMRASWFKKQGYRPVDRTGMQVLLWKPFTDDARAPRWMRPKKRPEPRPGKADVTVLINGWCPAMNMVTERAKRASAEFGDKADFRLIEVKEPAAIAEWGMSDGLYIGGKQVRTGPPPSFARIRKRVLKEAKKAGWRPEDERRP